MASELFVRLYHKAQQRERLLISEVGRVWQALEMDDLQAATRLALGLQEAHEDFLDGLEPIARSMGRSVRNGCPHCGDPNCQGGNLHALPGGLIMAAGASLAGLLKQMMQGPQQPPEDQK